MKGRMGGVLLSFIIFLSASCTVKEDREPCPCFLNVSFANPAIALYGADLLGWRDGELFSAGVIPMECDPYWTKAVRKGSIVLSAWCGNGAVPVSGHHAIIRSGNQCDSLYAFFGEVDCTGDMAYSEVTFHKQFCTVTLDLRRTEQNVSDYSFLVKGNTQGFDLLSFKPLAGEFRCRPAAVPGERTVSVRVPRQFDNSLSFTLSYIGQEVGSFPLGQYIANLGYDWSEDDLRDITVTIDLVVGQVLVSVEGWQSGYTFSFIEQ